MSPQQMNISAHAAPSHYTSVDAINRHDYGVQKARKPASTGGGRAWSDDEEAYLRQARLQKMPYKHIAAHLKKTELACRLHHHQLSHGSNRRTRTSSVTSSNAGSNAGSNASSIAGSDAGSSTPSPIMSHSMPSPISENMRAATPPTYNYSRQPSFHVQLPSAAMLIQRADSSSPPPQRVSHPVAILPKPSSPHRALSDSAANLALRLDCGLASGPVNIPAVDQERLRQIYDAHRASFWGLVACEYGAGASPLLLEETWKRGILTTNALPTPCVSPAPDAQPFHDIHLGYNTKPLHRLPTPVPETKLNATSISALLGIDASPRSPSEREFVRRMEERRDNRATNMADPDMHNTSAVNVPNRCTSDTALIRMKMYLSLDSALRVDPLRLGYRVSGIIPQSSLAPIQTSSTVHTYPEASHEQDDKRRRRRPTQCHRPWQSISRSLTMSPTIIRLCRSGLSSPRCCISLVPTTRRLYSSSLADLVAADFLSRSQFAEPHTQTQRLDANQLQRLCATLARPELAQGLPENGTPLPAGYHLAYFAPSQAEDELGRDGTETTFNPPSPFTRRMWAGGELEWVGGGNKLRIGQEATEITRFTSAAGKEDRAGGGMIIVGVEKKLQNEHGVVLVDKRNWIFRPEITVPVAPARKPAPVPFAEGRHVRDFNQTPVALFRFSALTFNAHKIHYSREWCEQVEGHRNLVVHGPLNLINILDLWRDVHGGDSTLKRIAYRATSPLYVSEDYRIVMQDEVDKVTEVKIVDSYGQVSMKANIESF